jgi:PKHD-type hydroxylase
MFLPIPNVLKADEVRSIRERLEKERFTDGGSTAGRQARRVKRNQQLPREGAVARELGRVVLQALQRHAGFNAATLPHRVTAPLFNLYAGGMTYGPHVDNAIMYQPQPLRSDVSVTVFLSEPGEYDGGELVIEDGALRQKVKLPAGSALAYPSTSVHHVEPVTRGARYAAVVWVQSLVRDPERRRILFDLDRATQALLKRDPEAPEARILTASYHNLVRLWAEA